MADPVNHILESQILTAAEKPKIGAEDVGVSKFSNTYRMDKGFLRGASHLSQTRFHIAQRKRLKILVHKDGHQVRRKWSLDAENRKKLPRNIFVPDMLK